MLCEYDSWVLVRDGRVDAILDNSEGNSIERSRGRPIDVGEPITGDTVPYQADSPKPLEGVSQAMAYRDKGGQLHTGCTPESAIILSDAPDIGPPPLPGDVR